MARERERFPHNYGSQGVLDISSITVNTWDLGVEANWG